MLTMMSFSLSPRGRPVKYPGDELRIYGLVSSILNVYIIMDVKFQNKVN